MNLYYDKVNLEFSIDEADSIRWDLIRFLKDNELTEEDINKYPSFHELCNRTFGVWSGLNSVKSHVNGTKR